LKLAFFVFITPDSQQKEDVMAEILEREQEQEEQPQVDWLSMAQKQLVKEHKKLTPAAVMLKGIEIIRWVEKNKKAARHILNGGKFYRRADGRLYLEEREFGARQRGVSCLK
jgi:hypothetical protein